MNNEQSKRATPAIAQAPKKGEKKEAEVPTCRGCRTFSYLCPRCNPR